METVFTRYTRRKGWTHEMQRWRFSKITDGERISMGCTPQSLDLKDQAIIDCLYGEDTMDASHVASEDDTSYFLLDKFGRIRFSSSDKDRCLSELAFLPTSDEPWVLGNDVSVEFRDHSKQPLTWRRGFVKKARRIAAQQGEPICPLLGSVWVQPLKGGECVKLDLDLVHLGGAHGVESMYDVVKQDQRTPTESLDYIRSEVLRTNAELAAAEAEMNAEAAAQALLREEAEKVAEAAAEALLAEEASSNGNGKNGGGGGNGAAGGGKKSKKAKAKEKEQAAERRRLEREAERRAAEKADRDAQIAAVDARRREALEAEKRLREAQAEQWRAGKRTAEAAQASQAAHGAAAGTEARATARATSTADAIGTTAASVEDSSRAVAASKSTGSTDMAAGACAALSGGGEGGRGATAGARAAAATGADVRASGGADDAEPPDLLSALRAIGIEAHAALFETQEIDVETLPLLTEADLADIGLTLGAIVKIRRFRARGAAAERARDYAPTHCTRCATRLECPACDTGAAHAECVVCLDGRVQCAVVPCGHYCVCAECAVGLTMCPMCRGPVERTLEIFDVS